MQKLYAMFPAGWPGCALLLLRLSVAAHALTAGALAQDPRVPAWIRLLCVLACLLLTVGFSVAPVAALLAVLALGFFSGAPDSCEILYAIVDAVALAILGPGAFSLDAHLYGRREIVLTGRSGKHDANE
ncbi:MAG: hypothetical protein J0I77_04535 [Rudaea sp.]|uniref:hypothetical protein n=1 Tax=unclassified Rudaea TaxID=2627037 RepID=UPI0010F4D6E4|nr:MULTISPECIES: hypothetical protein [unclassified Rudaea]MBN8884961.1 hypothetical protein [Rudaea sp.]MBR0347400.1 hypothetical protein [Rudaea sp.]